VALAKTSKSKTKTNTKILWPQAKTNASALKTKANTSKGKAKAKTKHHWPRVGSVRTILFDKWVCVEDQLADGDDVLKCFRPIFNSMKPFGLYFTASSHRDINHVACR